MTARQGFKAGDPEVRRTADWSSNIVIFTPLLAISIVILFAAAGVGYGLFLRLAAMVAP